MQRCIWLTAAVVVFAGSFAQAQEKPASPPAEAPVADPTHEEATKLEAQLTKYNDSAPEAADVMVKLIDLYHANGRVFGLIRVGQRFIAAHTNDPRHKDAMLKLLDGLEATSRNKETTVVCRQFLTRYPDVPEAAAVEIRLGNTLVELNDPAGAGEAYAAVWKRKPGAETRNWGVKAIANLGQSNDKKIFSQAATLAEEMVDVLPAGEFTTHVGWQAIYQWRRGSEWAKSNLACGKMLKKGLPALAEGQRELHATMAENFGNLGQHANAVESYKKVRALGDSPYYHMQMIFRMHYAGAKAAEMEPVVAEYMQKYPARQDRFQTRSYLAHAYLRENDRAKAVAIIAEILPFDAVTNSNASIFVQYSPQEPANFPNIERVLVDAINRNAPHAYFLRYSLALELYRDRIKDVAKTKQVLRDQLAKSVTNDGHTTYAIEYLLSNAADDAEFQADVQRVLACRRDNLDYGNITAYPAGWIAANKANKDLKARVALLQEELKKQNEDPIVKAFAQIGNSQSRSGEPHRELLLQPANFAKLNDRVAASVARMQGEYFWYYAGNKQKQASGVFSQLAQRLPNDFYANYHALYTAVDYNPPEVQKEAALRMVKIDPEVQVADAFYRLMAAVDRNADPALGQQAYQWILKSQEKHGKDPTYASYVSDVLLKQKLTAEATAYLTTYATFNRNHSESRECATRLLALKATPEEKLAFAQEMLKHDSDYLGRYAEWVADHYFKLNNLDQFEKALRDARKRQDERPFRIWDLYDYTCQGWVDALRNKADSPEADRRRVYTVVRDMEVLRASASGQLALLEITPDDGKAPMKRLLEWQSATRWMYNDSHDWDRLMPFVQAALTRKDYMAAATLLTGMLSNISYTEDGRKKAGRDLVAQSYARVGAAGLTIDEKSPIAPLMQAALYLRLGDEALAFDTYAANKALFDQHRDEVPPDLLLFVCESLVAGGGDENHARVEDILRAWLVKNAASTVVEESLKARVKLLLARNFFKAQRYDLARTEFTTVINQHPGTPQSVEAEFGIGETFMAQKVYDQAQIVFEKLSNSRDAEVIVRAEFLRGVLSYRRGDKDEARDIFRAVLDKVPNIDLANQALYNLSEVYGSEERYIDQLNLLRTVGRLGRTSKRWHAPGTPLSIVVQDSDLGISRGHNRIPVRVTTEPGGDSELIYLTSGGAGKGLFRADLDTRLGQATKDDHVLQLTGKDVIKCDYPDEFKAEFKSVPLSDVEIKIASDAKFEIASAKIVDKLAETFSEQLRREQADDADDKRVSQTRPSDQVKPGNLVYLRVQDGDRDLTHEVDKIVVKLQADSGDQVQVSLSETEAHSGIFEGTVKTAELPAGALASDTSIQHSPLMAIDRDRASTWMSEPDGGTPKWLSVDMKDLKLVSRIRLHTPEADKHAPVRGTVYGSNDGLYWFRLASNPLDIPVEPAFLVDSTKKGAPDDAAKPQAARMTRRVYLGNHTGFTEWSQIVALGRNGKPLATDEVDELSWVLPEEADNAKSAHTVIWSGKLVQERAGAARIHVQAARTAIVVDGYLELPVGPGGRHADVWLEPGLHDVTIFAATTTPQSPMLSFISRSDQNRADILLEPFRAADFDLEGPAAQRVSSSKVAPASPKVSVADRSWEFQVSPVELRYVKFVIHEYLGEALAINHVELAGEEEDEVYVPTETDVLSLSSNSVLEIAGGDVVTGTFADEFTQGEGGRSRLLTSKLTATYFNGVITPIAYDFVRQPNGAVQEIRKQVMRIDPGERFVVEVYDYDRDESDEQDEIRIQVSVNDGEPIELVATETEKYSGRFTKEVDTSATKADGKLLVKKGDRIYCRYLDAQNTFPGHSVPRETVVYVNEPSTGQIRIYETRVIPAPAETKQPPQIIYRAPGKSQDVSGVAFEAPFTVEVIDPDAARDSRSSVIVKLKTSDGASVDVKCVVSDAFSTSQGAYGYLGQYGYYNSDVRALQEGRFVGQIIMQLGGKNSTLTVPLTSEMPRNLVGGPAMSEDEEKSALDKTLITKVLNLTGKDVIAAAYQDAQRPAGKATVLGARGRLISNGVLAAVDRDYQKPVTQLHVGEKLYLTVTDFDRDTSDERDATEVEITTARGDKETVPLEETLAHSGVFTGSIFLKPSEKPTPGNYSADDPAIETYFGDDVKVRYVDKAASTENGTLEVGVEIPVVVGTDGLVAAFSKTFNDEKLAVETKFHVAESYFELFKSHKKLSRESEQKSDLEAGRRVLREVMEDYPDPKYVPRIAYLLGQFAQELGQTEEAVQSYEMIVQQFPEHPLAADAQYKLAQAYEESGSFENALEGYVTLAATYPKSPLIPNVMIRISDHFYKAEKFEIAAQVGEKFLERFDAHQYASRIAFRVGQCYYKSKKFPKAGQAFDLFGKKFPDDALASDALFWSGESFRMGGNNSEAFRRYNNCRWNFPSSESAKYARGRLALPEMLQQFEAEANSLDNQNQ